MISELANHLWQSTLFAVAVGLLTVMCRKNDASVRYWLWFSASVKFFIPFTLLMALVDRLEWASRAPQIAAPAVSALAQVTRPFMEDSAVGVLFVPEAPRGFDWSALALLVVWVSGIIAMTVIRLRMWRRIRAAVRTSSSWAAPNLSIPAVESEAPRRLQSLLAERFALKAHREKRDLPIYALVLARADKSPGPRLRRSQFDPETIKEQDAKLLREGPATFTPLQCGLIAGRRLGSCGSTIAELATRFPMYVGRLVVDRTGLTGLYQYDLRFGDQPIPGAGPGGGFPFPTQPADPDAPTLFTALEEQLGLKLVPQTAPVEVLVIDHVQPPKPN